MKKLFIFAMIMVFIVGMTSLVGAYDLTARSFGMGGTFTGIANDVSTVIYNPAGLSQSGSFGLQFNGGIVSPDLGDLVDLTDLIDNIKQGKIDDFPTLELNGQALLGANLSSLGLVLNVKDRFTTSDLSNGGVRLNNEITSEGIIGIGNDYISLPMGLSSLAYGLNLKMNHSDLLRYDLENNIRTDISATGSGLALDAGLLLKATNMITIGAQVRNIWAQEYERSGTKKKYDIINDNWVDEDGTYLDTITPERVMRVGASVRVPIINITVAADIDNVPLLTETEEDMILHLGVEKGLFFNLLSLRAGVIEPQAENSLRTYTAGLGVNLLKASVNAAVGVVEELEEVTAVVSGVIKF